MSSNVPTMEFHIARTVRESLDIDDLLFSYTGNVVFANVAGSRKLAQQLNESRLQRARALNPGAASPDKSDSPDTTIHAGALFAMGLIDELSHALIDRYREEVDPAIFADALRAFEAQLGVAGLNRLLLDFIKQFPNVAIFRGDLTASEWLSRSTGGIPHREAALEELLLLWLGNTNPAFAPFRELFADTGLQGAPDYRALTAALPDYFDSRRPISPEIGSLLDALRAPALASPDSLTAQLDFIRTQWGKYLGDTVRRTLLAIDTLREEDLAIWAQFHPPGPGRPQRGEPGFRDEGFDGDEYTGFDGDYEWVTGPDGQRIRQRRYDTNYQAPLVEYEAFSADQAWMPNVVLLAKSTYVWLEQLSKKYLRHIHRLDQIPDAELQLMADRGITGLWLIGLWERSVASRTIKRLRGQGDAVASAYSLKDYNIAEDLGGNQAYEFLRDRAAAVGLRLASDMVPNHMGIDSSWVIENPDWFLYRWESPFPVYKFEGPDLSDDPRVEIKIEDHYYEETDAAVVFRLRHHGDGATRFVYHGNDGTTFAWNDTAQLDYSKAAVREHVMQVILHVARLFPIIRFDAAMVLAKRHVQRLWFPLPGAGGSIPSRAENAMSQEEFDALMPLEFWREVVDRVAAEVPGTLLLAEAFWLLEGYFVRTLGMHRVYNSAFMVMLRDEENAKYRSYLQKTMEFDPDILKRYVNFMSNPDERTAIDQFGSGDKFFGVSTLLATLPGLPMFAHGQIEGFTERYGMEFKQAKMDERPNDGLISRYQHEIAPLLKRRYIFAESANFTLYDLWTGSGSVDENVFAYSNNFNGERSLIVYNNTYGSTAGTLHHSSSYMDKGSGEMRQRSLAQGLDLPYDDRLLVAYRDTTSNLEYLRRATDIHHNGLYLELRGYQYVVLLNFRALTSTAERPWDRLFDALNGAGVYSLEEALLKLQLRPLHETLRQALSADTVCTLAQTEIPGLEPFLAKASLFLEKAVEYLQAEHQPIHFSPSVTAASPSAPQAPSRPSQAAPRTATRAAAATKRPSSQTAPLVNPTNKKGKASTPTTTEPLAIAASATFNLGEAAPSTTIPGEPAAYDLTAALETYRSNLRTLTLAALAATAPEATPLATKTPAAKASGTKTLATTASKRVASASAQLKVAGPKSKGPTAASSANFEPTATKVHAPDSTAFGPTETLAPPTARPEQTLAPILAWALIRALPLAGDCAVLFDRLQLRSALAEIFTSLGIEGEDSWRAAAELRILLAHADKPDPTHTEAFWQDGDVRWLTGVNLADGITWFHRDGFAQLLPALERTQLLLASQNGKPTGALTRSLANTTARTLTAAATAGYQLHHYLHPQPPTQAPTQDPLPRSKTRAAANS